MKTKQKIIKFNNQEVVIVRKRIKNLYLKVASPSGLIKVTAPYHLKEDVVFEFLEKRKEWIEKNQNIIRSKKLNKFLYKTGEKHYFLGDKYDLEIVKDRKEGVNIVGNKIMIFVKDINVKSNREKVILKWYKKELEEYIVKNKAKWEGVIGKEAKEWRIKKMKTRWGSCNSSAKRIWISLEIIKKPKTCIDYIMVHELLHFVEKNHGKRFYQLLQKYYPEYKTAEKILKTT